MPGLLSDLLISFQELAGRNDFVEVTLIDEGLRRTIANNEHWLNSLAPCHRLEQLDLALHARDDLDADRVRGVFHLAHGEYAIGAVEYQINLYAWIARACRQEVRPHREVDS